MEGVVSANLIRKHEKKQIGTRKYTSYMSSKRLPIEGTYIIRFKAPRK